MGGLLYISPFLVVLVGVLFGYFFKRLVIVVVTVPPVCGILWALFAMDHREWGGIIAIIIALQCAALIVPMWITHFVKHAGGVGMCLRRLSDAMLDTKKTPK